MLKKGKLNEKGKKKREREGVTEEGGGAQIENS